MTSDTTPTTIRRFALGELRRLVWLLPFGIVAEHTLLGSDMSFFHKSAFSSRSRSSDELLKAADQLRREILALESEMRESMRALADAQATAAAAEARAMEAIRAGDDRAARVSLLEQQACTEKVAVIAADTHVLRAILDECYQFAGKAAGDSSAPGS